MLAAQNCHRFVRIAIAAAALAAALTSCGKGPPAAPPGQPTGVVVTIAKAEARDVERKVHVVGSLAALEKVTLSNRVTGTVEKLHVDLGSVVKPGDTLAEIEPKRFSLAVEQAKDSLAESLARLGVTAIPEDDSNIDKTAPVEKALSEWNAAQVKYDRTDSLYKQKLVNNFEFLDAQAVLKVALATLRTAREDTRAQIAAARGWQTMIELKSKDFDDAIIKAPRDLTPGRIDTYTVQERSVSVGQYLREGTAMFTLVADRTLKLQGRVPERFLAEVKLGQDVAFRVEAYPGVDFVGKVSALDPTVDSVNRTFLVEATVDNKDGRLHAGSFVQADILTRHEQAVLVPVDAITSFAGVTKTFVIGEGEGKTNKARELAVEMGEQFGKSATQGEGGAGEKWVEVRNGALKAGEIVATSGLSKLVDGAAVEIRQAIKTSAAQEGH